MTIGPGKYDDLCTHVRVQANAEGVLLVVLGGKHGHGFSCQASIDVMRKIPALLDEMASQMRHDLTQGGDQPTNDDHYKA